MKKHDTMIKVTQGKAVITIADSFDDLGLRSVSEMIREMYDEIKYLRSQLNDDMKYTEETLLIWKK